MNKDFLEKLKNNNKKLPSLKNSNLFNKNDNNTNNDITLYNPTMEIIKDFEKQKKLPIYNNYNKPTNIINLQNYTNFFNENSNIIEFGTKRSNINIKTSREDIFKYKSYLKTDIELGIDVDIVCDIHECSSILGENKFDGIVCMNVFAHISKPWIAAKELYKINNQNGYVFISTHQTFPLHGYPNDYFRFSTDALKSIMEDAGYKTISCYYSEPCTIIPENISLIYPNWNYLSESYLYVTYIGQK